VGRALGLPHRQPAQPWTLDALAREAGTLDEAAEVASRPEPHVPASRVAKPAASPARDYGLSGPAGAFFGASVLYPFAFQSFSGQNVEVW